MLTEWFQRHRERDRLVVWIAIAMCLGIALHLNVLNSLPLRLPVLIIAGLLLARSLISENFEARLILVLLSLVCLGWLISALHANRSAHAYLTNPYEGAVTARIESVVPRGSDFRLILLPFSSPEFPWPERVKISVRRGQVPENHQLLPGQVISTWVHVFPVSSPVIPGGYDPAYGNYFEEVGAIGRATAPVRPFPSGSYDVSMWERLRALVTRWRLALRERVLKALPKPSGAIAAALITGMRDAIDPQTSARIRESGLMHILAISGLHMALFAGSLVIFTRAVLACRGRWLLERPIKKWAAALGIMGGAAYLVLSGAPLSAQRAFIMLAVGLVSIIADRRMVSLRNVSLSAIVVLVIFPHALLTAGFQLSFLATTGLVLVFERRNNTETVDDGMVIRRWNRVPTLPFTRGAAYLGRFIYSVALASLTATLSIFPVVLFHFGTVSTIGILSNLLVLPVVALWVLPLGAIAVISAPFGLDGWFLSIMGIGIDWLVWISSLMSDRGEFQMVRVDLSVAATLVTTSCILLGFACRPASRLFWISLGLIAFGFWPALPTSNIFASESGRSVWIRGFRSASSFVSQIGTDERYALALWTDYDWKVRGLKEHQVFLERRECKAHQCRYEHPVLGTIIHVRRFSHRERDPCPKADVVISGVPMPPRCDAPQVIDTNTLAQRGAISVGVRPVVGAEPRTKRHRIRLRGSLDKATFLPAPPWESRGRRRTGHPLADPVN